ncbi:hypothetical protein OU5_3203 [Pseudomonas mandelii JR-1]|jgi:hypothetical protein|uniref:Glycosyltransferase RgtA/B/C/D-like domain-containing protein n=2 Tax=Pseudomonas mandelii TaxID=75612 RepID=A0A024EBX2_9PSED|nr:hypothetical protein OU5_3203 [Pseudomonas mandelii JR-1]OYQ17179.1 hypothetical protein B7L09_15980 [Pseudomonas mandelii]
MYKMTERTASIVIGLFFFTLLSGIVIPVYSDEIVSKWSVSRFFLEDQHLVSFFPQCSTMSDRAVSWVFYPAAALISTIYSNLSPLGTRLSGIVLTLVWFGLLTFWCFKQTNEKSGMTRLAGLIAFSSLGVLPYLLVLSRSEQFMTLPILVFCLTAFYFKAEKTVFKQCLGALLLTFILSCFFYVHPKSLFFLPFLLVALWLTTETYHTLIRCALLVYALVLFAQVLHESNAIAACTDAPAMQALLAANTLLPGMLFSAPLDFINAASNNLLNFPDKLLLHLTFNPVSQSGWLPPIESSDSFFLYLNFVIKYLLYAFIIGTHLAGLLIFMINIVRRKLSAPVFLAALLASADIFNALFFNIQNFYAATQFLPIAIILAALLLHNITIPKWRGYSAVGYSAILIISILSMMTLLLAVFPATLKNSASAAATLPGQPLSIPVFNTQSHLKSIEKLGASCGLPPDNTRNMVVDHMTYFAYMKAKNPIHVLYVSEYGFGGDLSNGRLLPFLKKLKSPGVISRCEWMPLQFRNVQKSDDMGYCCVNLDDL